jgi:hypothetical protein
MEYDQITIFGALAVFIILGLAVVFGVLAFVRAINARIARLRAPAKMSREEPSPSYPLEPLGVAGDLLAIRSNLLAVTRQLEDLERRIRLNSIAPPRQSRPPQPVAPAEAVSA